MQKQQIHAETQLVSAPVHCDCLGVGLEMLFQLLRGLSSAPACLVVLGEGGGVSGLILPAARESHTAVHTFYPQHWSQGLWTVWAQNSVLCAPRRRGSGLRPGEGTVLCVFGRRALQGHGPSMSLGAGVGVLHTHPSPEQCSSQLLLLYKPSQQRMLSVCQHSA